MNGDNSFFWYAGLESLFQLTSFHPRLEAEPIIARSITIGRRTVEPDVEVYRLVSEP